MMISVSVYKEEFEKVHNCPDVNKQHRTFFSFNIGLQEKEKEQGISNKTYYWKNPNQAFYTSNIIDIITTEMSQFGDSVEVGTERFSGKGWFKPS